MKPPRLITSPLQRLRLRGQRLDKALGGRYWFPHAPLSLMLGLAGLWILQSAFGLHWSADLRSAAAGQFHPDVRALPSLFIGGGMTVMAVALLWRSRIAWLAAVLLSVVAALNAALGAQAAARMLAAYALVLLACLILARRRFNRSSVAASTLFAFTSTSLLLLYAAFGALYLGADF
ncbi:MAG: potassium transporter, partial [Elusimicrobia bacterium]|nr:potassium transporter [Elusimicrobiota bacterium]